MRPRRPSRRLSPSALSPTRSSPTPVVRLPTSFSRPARTPSPSARIIEAAHKEAEEIIAKAHTTVEDERKSIYAGAASSIADLSVAVATKIVGEALEDEGEQKKLIERYIQEAGSLNAD